jgi:hypothetical protein
LLATGVSVAAAASVVLAPTPTAPLPSLRADSVALTGTWQQLADNTTADLAKLTALSTNYPIAPILSQLAQNVATYGRWLAGQDGGNPLMVAQTVAQHAMAVVTTIGTFAVVEALSFVGTFIAPGVMVAQLIVDTATSPSTPLTVLQAFVDAPAVYLNTTLNCCSTPVFKLAFGLLNPGPLGYLLALAPSIAQAMQIPKPSSPLPSASATEPAAAQQLAPALAIAQTRRSQSTTTAQKTVAPSSAKRPAAARKPADGSARDTTSGGQGHSARPHRQASGD